MMALQCRSVWESCYHLLILRQEKSVHGHIVDKAHQVLAHVIASTLSSTVREMGCDVLLCCAIVCVVM